MRAIRWLAAGVVAAFAAFAVYGLAWQPFRCNVMDNRLQRLADEIFDLPNGLTVMMEARQAIAIMQQCIAACPTDVDMYMTLAAHDRVLGRLQHAADMYGQALKYDRRPELFFNLGVVQLEMNQRDAAIVTLTTACSFDIRYADDIPDPNVREAVLTAVQLKKERGFGEARQK